MAMPSGLANLEAKNTAGAVFRRHDLALPYDAQELNLTKKHVYEMAGSRAVSDRLLEKMFPKLQPMEVWHFTKPSVLPLILAGRTLRLSTVSRNLDANEYRMFLKEHGYSAGESKAMREELAGHHFYLSTTAVGSESQHSHWNVFADGGDGYRLRLRLSPVKADLRKIRYHPSEKSLLSKLDEELSQEIGRTFFPYGVSRITAFSLRHTESYEDEIRLLVSNPPTSWVHGVKRERYIELALNSDNEACRIDLLGVTCGKPEDVSMIEAELKRGAYSGVVVDSR